MYYSENIKYKVVIIFRMQEEIIAIALGLLCGYYLLRWFDKKNRVPAKDTYSNILTNKKYEVKGQWEKEE